MTLATTCPVCKTSFKVIPDQLKLRRGLVRCGSCHTVFSGIDHLRQVNDEPGSPQDQAPELSLAGAVPAEDLAETTSEFIAENASVQHDEAIAESSANTQSELNADCGPGQNADTVSELITESEFEQREESAVEPMELEIPPAMQVPQEDAIDFFSESAQRRIRWWPRGRLGKAFAIVLLVALALQLALGLRSEIVARFPPARGALEALAQPLGLKVELPRNPKKITIEIDLSIGDAPGRYRMNALLRSHSETALQWPAIEISLTDANGATVVRRVLMPSDYLADQATIVAGLPGRSEQNLRVNFLLRDVVLTGYSAVLFYP